MARRAMSPPLRSRLHDVELATSRRTILTVGQIAPFKGTHLTIEAMMKLLREGYDVQAIVVGATPVWPPDLVAFVRELHDGVAERGANDRVHFVGARKNVLAIMRASYVLAAPILQEETFGNVHADGRARASVNSLAEAARDEDCNARKFERRWWALFEQAS